jgi:hypothetical protein
VLADVDGVTTFAPEPDAELVRDPSRVVAAVYMDVQRLELTRLPDATREREQLRLARRHGAECQREDGRQGERAGSTATSRTRARG